MKRQGTLLVVDDNRNILTTVRMLLDDTFEHIVTQTNPNAIPAALREHQPDVVLLDMNFQSGMNTGNEGLYWLREVKKLRPQTQVVLFTAYADIELAVTGLKEGATDFIVKPFQNAKMLETMRAARTAAMGSTTSTADAGRGSKGKGSPLFWGQSDVMERLRQMTNKVAATDANILITGENGTGKEMLANEIHRLSPRAKGPMMPIDMGAISETLFESELFGSMKGAYTDAKHDRPGKFEMAEGGTLFLDEIGNLSYALQAKLLTALQRRAITRVGGQAEIPINVRLVCATNRDLPAMVADGTFREDLLYRINTIHLHLPPLRQRRDDIVPLAEMFLTKYADIYGKQPLCFTTAAKQKLREQAWQGNIRELEHAVEKAVILSDGHAIGADDVESAPHRGMPSAAEVTTLDEMERRMIAKAIADSEGNLSMVATRLGISRQTLYNKIKRYGL